MANAKVIENAEGMRNTPSIVDSAMIGEKDHPPRRPERPRERTVTIQSRKLLQRSSHSLADRYDDPMVEEGQELSPYKIVQGIERDGMGRSDQQNLFAIRRSPLSFPSENESDRRKHSSYRRSIRPSSRSRPIQRRQSQAHKDAGKIAGTPKCGLINEQTEPEERE